LANDPRPVNFAFVSCQSVNEGKLNGYRRMIFEDERAAPADQLGFVRWVLSICGPTRRTFPMD
jgi:alkaline phosphatase D